MLRQHDTIFFNRKIPIFLFILILYSNINNTFARKIFIGDRAIYNTKVDGRDVWTHQIPLVKNKYLLMYGINILRLVRPWPTSHVIKRDPVSKLVLINTYHICMTKT